MAPINLIAQAATTTVGVSFGPSPLLIAVRFAFFAIPVAVAIIVCWMLWKNQFLKAVLTFVLGGSAISGIIGLGLIMDEHHTVQTVAGSAIIVVALLVALVVAVIAKNAYASAPSRGLG